MRVQEQRIEKIVVKVVYIIYIYIIYIAICNHVPVDHFDKACICFKKAILYSYVM